LIVCKYLLGCVSLSFERVNYEWYIFMSLQGFCEKLRILNEIDNGRKEPLIRLKMCYSFLQNLL